MRMRGDKPKIHFHVTREMKNGINAIAKEHNMSISAMMRTLIADVLDDEIVDDTEFRPYKRRKERGND